MATVRQRFGAKQEAQWQRNRWKTRELVVSRRHLSEFMDQRPWIPYFYRTMLMLETGRRISGLLDVGCGSGFLARLFGRELVSDGKISDVIGVDISRKSLQAAKGEEAHLPSAETGKIEYIEADAYHLPFRPGSFDLVTSRTVLMHLSSPMKALREMTRVCRRNGHVAPIEPDWGIFGSYNPKDSQSGKEEEAALRAEIRGRRKLYGQDSAIGRRLPDLLHRAGLRDITIDGIFEVPMTPCDYRTKRRHLIQECSLQLKSRSDRKRLDEYTRVLVAGGLSKAWIRRYLRRDRARLIRRLRQLKSRGEKERMTNFFTIPFFLAMGKK
jgi:SAM-dependent methyltransferase